MMSFPYIRGFHQRNSRFEDGPIPSLDVWATPSYFLYILRWNWRWNFVHWILMVNVFCVQLCRLPFCMETSQKRFRTCCCWTLPHCLWALRLPVVSWLPSSSATPPSPPSRPRPSPPTPTTSLECWSRWVQACYAWCILWPEFKSLLCNPGYYTKSCGLNALWDGEFKCLVCAMVLVMLFLFSFTSVNVKFNFLAKCCQNYVLCAWGQISMCQQNKVILHFWHDAPQHHAHTGEP